MEKFGISGLWTHVGSTVLAGLLPIGDALLNYLNVVALPTWAHALVGLAATFFALYKGKIAALAPVQDPPKGVAALDLMLVVGAALLLAVTFLAPRPAHAQSANPPDSAPLAVQLTPDLSLRLNVSVLAGSYDLTHRAWLGQAPITGLYALSSHRLLDAGIAAGGSLTFDTSSKPQGQLNAGLVSPKIVVSPTLSLHAAVLYGRRFGSDPANLVQLVPTVEF